MDPTAPKTYLILLNALARREFSQRELARDLQFSVGHINRVVRWLEENHFVERGLGRNRNLPGRTREVYSLVNPTGMLRAVSLFRPMRQLRRFSLTLDSRKEKVISDLARRQIVFCLGTALERFSEFYRPDEISFYALAEHDSDSPEAVRRDLSAWGEGITRVSCYALESRLHGRRREEPAKAVELFDYLESAGFLERSGSGLFTTKVQTVIDLFCDGKAFATRDLLRELWGVEL
ncbi:MAG: hypothetical protein ACE5HJ_09625 [Thermoplasmata archaeon]